MQALSWLQREEVGQGRKEMSLPPAVETSASFQRAAEISNIFLYWWRFCIYKTITRDRDTVLCYNLHVAFPCSSSFPVPH